MKKRAVVPAVVFLVGSVWAGPSHGFTKTTTLDVELTIASSCEVSTPSPATMTFPTITETTTGTVNQTGTVEFTITCENGTAWTVTDDKGGVSQGAGGMTDISSTLDHTVEPVSISYAAHYAPNSGTGTGAAQTVDITAEVGESDYAGNPSGLYRDTIVFSVDY